MAVEQNPGNREVVKGKAEAWVGSGSEPSLNPKNNTGSLIPPRRKLVKKMMLDCIVRFIASMFGAQGRPTPTTSSGIHSHGGSGHWQMMLIPPPNPKEEKNVRKIRPHP